MGLCVFCSSVIFCERKNAPSLKDETHVTRWGVLSLNLGSFYSLTERTEFTEPFGAQFEPTERLRHTEVTEAFQLRLAVTFCEIG